YVTILDLGQVDYDSGWLYYHGPNGFGMDGIDAYFNTKGLPAPNVIGNKLTAAFPAYQYVMGGLTMYQIEDFTTEFDGAWNTISIKFAKTGGKNLVWYGGGYWLDVDTGQVWRPSWLPAFYTSTTDPNLITLQDAVSKICKRGGLTDNDIDISGL